MDTAQTVSLVRVIANPEEFDQQLISFSGHLILDREAAFIALDQYSAENWQLENMIVFFPNAKELKFLQDLSGRNVQASGVFTMNRDKAISIPPVGMVTDVQVSAVGD